MVVRYILKYGYAVDLSDGESYAIFTCIRLFHLWTIYLLIFLYYPSIPNILFLHLKPIAAFSISHPNLNPTKILCSPRRALGMNSMDVFKQMNYSKELSKCYFNVRGHKGT